MKHAKNWWVVTVLKPCSLIMHYSRSGTFRLGGCLRGRCRLQESNNRSSVSKTIYYAQFQSYDMCSSASRLMGRLGKVDTHGGSTVSQIPLQDSVHLPSITRAFVWNHGILAYGIDVTGMGPTCSGTFINFKSKINKTLWERTLRHRVLG